MKVKKFVFCFLFFTHAINLAEEKVSDNKNITISTIKEDNLINENNWNTRKWGSMFLLFNPLTFWASFSTEYSWLTFFHILSSDILYRYIFKKGVGFMAKIGFSQRVMHGKVLLENVLEDKNMIENDVCTSEFLIISPSLTFSFCWVYKKKGRKIFSGSFAPIGIGFRRVFFDKKDQKLVNPFFLFLSLSFLHYENGKGFFLSWGQVDLPLKSFDLAYCGINFFLSILHLELGFSLLKSKHLKKNIDM